MNTWSAVGERLELVASGENNNIKIEIRNSNFRIERKIKLEMKIQ